MEAALRRALANGRARLRVPLPTGEYIAAQEELRADCVHRLPMALVRGLNFRDSTQPTNLNKIVVPDTPCKQVTVLHQRWGRRHQL